MVVVVAFLFRPIKCQHFDSKKKYIYIHKCTQHRFVSFRLHKIKSMYTEPDSHSLTHTRSTYAQTLTYEKSQLNREYVTNNTPPKRTRTLNFRRKRWNITSIPNTNSKKELLIHHLGFFIFVFR